MSARPTRYQRFVRALGFSRTYNFPLWVIFGGILVAFSLARLSYLSNSALESHLAPGEWYWFRRSLHNTALKIHLGCILPCGILGAFQFLPVIRHKALIIHRIDGYLVLLLLWVSTGAALAIARVSFGGTVETQGAVFALSFLTLTASALAYYNIKRLQIEQHRAWMLRVMVYMGSIITTRILLIIAAVSVSVVGSYHMPISCDEISFIVSNATRFPIDYPSCKADPKTIIPVIASMGHKFDAHNENVGAAFKLTFGLALWVAILVHVLAAEIYLQLTPAESERLRMVSYERQLERGWVHPGSSGLTSDRWGDSKWAPVGQEEPSEEEGEAGPAGK